MLAISDQFCLLKLNNAVMRVVAYLLAISSFSNLLARGLASGQVAWVWPISPPFTEPVL